MVSHGKVLSILREMDEIEPSTSTTDLKSSLRGMLTNINYR